MKNLLASGTVILLLFISLIEGQAQQITSGKSASQTRTLSNFSFIELKMSGTVYVKQGDQFSVLVEAPAEIINKITTEVFENTLMIENKNKYTVGITPAIKIYVSLPKPNGLEVKGSGSIIAQTNITTNFLSAVVEGSGGIKLMDVAAGKLNIQLEGSGGIVQKKATSESTLIEIRGSGGYECENVTGNLVSVSLDGSGDIKLSGVAAGKLWMQNNGSGSIRHVNGMASEVLLENNGSGSISAGDLNGGSISAANTGSGDIEVGSSETLNAQLSGSGDIRYHGMPKAMRKDISGSGNISQN
ncbi:MAG: DUF2807 domain-containing protein [Chitinophagales bacterium]